MQLLHNLHNTKRAKFAASDDRHASYGESRAAEKKIAAYA
jgi:hypothetical protein